MAATRPARLLAPLLALLLVLGLCATALASVAGSHGSAARGRPGKSARHARRRHSKHHARHRAARRTKKPARHSPAPPAFELIPAACEDGSLPSNSVGGAYSCEDGSAPACEEGTLRAAAGPPMCAVKPSPEGECAREAGECSAGVEFDCEDTGEDASGSCERPEEGEASEEEEE